MLKKETFLAGTKKPYEAMKALYLWSRENSSLKIKDETGFSYPTIRKLMKTWRQAVGDLDERGKVKANMVEADETFLGKRKYNRGNRSREKGPVCVQTVLRVEEKHGKRTGVKLRAKVITDRTKETLLGSIKRWVPKGSKVQTDGLRSYRGLRTHGFKHAYVEHKHEFVHRQGKEKHTHQHD